MKQGAEYLGSEDLITSSSNEEVIPSSTSAGWTFGYKLYKFSLYNDQDCHVLINNKKRLYLRAGQGFSMEQNDKEIESFIIEEAGITYNWVGAV